MSAKAQFRGNLNHYLNKAERKQFMSLVQVPSKVIDWDIVEEVLDEHRESRQLRKSNNV